MDTPPGTTPYLWGMPRVEIKPWTDEDRRQAIATLLEFRERKRRNQVVLLSILGFIVLLALLLPVGTISERFLVLFTLASLLPFPFGYTSVREAKLEKLARPQEIWVFDGRPPPRGRRIGFFGLIERFSDFRAKGPLEVFAPAMVNIGADGGISNRLSAPTPIFVSDASRAHSNQIGRAEFEELERARERLEAARWNWTAPVAVTSILACICLIDGWPSNIFLSFFVLLVVVFGIECAMRLGSTLYAFQRLKASFTSPDAVIIPVNSPAFEATADAVPELDGANQEIEVLSSGLLWRIDQKPAPWRIYGSEPVFVRMAALRLIAATPSHLPQHRATANEHSAIE